MREKPRGNGIRLAIGELLNCPWCAGQWIASLFTYGFIFSPQATRMAATIFTAASISDFMNMLYSSCEKKM